MQRYEVKQTAFANTIIGKTAEFAYHQKQISINMIIDD